MSRSNKHKTNISVEGKVVVVSHVFYMTGKDSKYFFIELQQNGSSKTNQIPSCTILARVKDLDRSLLNLQMKNNSSKSLIGKRFLFKNLQKVNVKAKSDQKIKHYKLVSTNEQSTACEVADNNLTDDLVGTHVFSSREFFSYEGVVTGTNESASGIYILDKKIKLVLTHICLVSNIPIFKKGHKINITNGHFEKCNETFHILWACARTSVSNVTNESVSKDLHDSGSRRIYDKNEYMKQKADPVLNLCHDWNLNVSEVLYLSEIYHMHFYMKFKTIIEEHMLNSVKCFVRFLNICGVDKITCNSSRCLITEFLSMPHECGPRISEERDRNLLEGIHLQSITLVKFKALMAKEFVQQKKMRKNKYSKIGNYNYSEMSDLDIIDKIDCFRETLNLHKDDRNNSVSCFCLIGVLEVDTKSGYLTLKDATGSVNILVYNFIVERDLCSGKLVKIKPKKVVFEWSFVLEKSWDITYVVIDIKDIETIDFATSERKRIFPERECNEKHQEWKVLYRSEPIFRLRRENPFVYLAVRKKIKRNFTTDDPQFQYDNDNNPIKFIELPVEKVPSSLFITPGTILKIKEQLKEEKFLSILQIYVKKLLELNPNLHFARILPKKICIEPADIDIQLVHETTLAKDFDGADFNSIPSNELVNIEILVKERWLEENPHLSADSNDEMKNDLVNQNSVNEESLPCGPLENVIMQIKFCDNEGSKISAYISHWQRRSYPLGIIPGFRVLLNNVIKIVSKKGNPYLISTTFTHIQLLDIAANSQNESTQCNIEDEFVKFTSLFSLLVASQLSAKKKLESFTSLLTLEKINKISICAKCQSCDSMVAKEKACTFVGCHVPLFDRVVNFKCSAIFHMEDETYSASIHVNDLTICRNFLFMLPDEEWNLILKTAEQKGEIVFLSKSKNEIADCNSKDLYSATATCFSIFCETYTVSNFLQYQCKLRPFAEKQNMQLKWNDNALNFICLEAKYFGEAGKSKAEN